MPPHKTTPANLDDEIAFVLAHLRYLEPWKRELACLLVCPGSQHGTLRPTPRHKRSANPLLSARR